MLHSGKVDMRSDDRQAREAETSEAVVGRRILARAIDIAIVTLASTFLAVMGFGAVLDSWCFFEMNCETARLQEQFGYALLVLAFLLPLLYEAVFGGHTPGKMITGLDIERHGVSAPWTARLLRAVVLWTPALVISAAIPFIGATLHLDGTSLLAPLLSYFAYLLWALVTGMRPLHDLIAGTTVVTAKSSRAGPLLGRTTGK